MRGGASLPRMMVERISTFEPGRSVGGFHQRLNSEASMWRRSMRRAVISWTLRSCCVKVFGRTRVRHLAIRRLAFQEGL